MPIHLPSPSRRQFLLTVGSAVGAATFAPTDLWANDIEDDLVYLLNDTHIGEKHPADSPVPSHLRQVVEELVGLERKPACVLVNGDLALKDGQPGDYRHLATLIRPLQDAKIDLHHNPRLGGDPNHFPGGLIDSEELWQVLAPRQHVKAYVHGHIHDRGLAENQGIHILNTPATSYVANPALSTTGWTTARLTATGATITTHTTTEDHPWNGQSQSLSWRR